MSMTTFMTSLLVAFSSSNTFKPSSASSRSCRKFPRLHPEESTFTIVMLLGLLELCERNKFDSALLSQLLGGHRRSKKRSNGRVLMSDQPYVEAPQLAQAARS